MGALAVSLGLIPLVWEARPPEPTDWPWPEELRPVGAGAREVGGSGRRFRYPPSSVW